MRKSVLFLSSIVLLLPLFSCLSAARLISIPFPTDELPQLEAHFPDNFEEDPSFTVSLPGITAENPVTESYSGNDVFFKVPGQQHDICATAIYLAILDPQNISNFPLENQPLVQSIIALYFPSAGSQPVTHTSFYLTDSELHLEKFFTPEGTFILRISLASEAFNV